MALHKPSDFFGRRKVEENKLPVAKSNETLREELSKVESLSEQLQQLQQDITQKVVKSDLESLVLSQINTMQENFETLQREFKKSNKGDLDYFKEIISEVTDTVNNLVENEIPKYKKQITSNEVRFGNQLKDFKEEVEDKVQNFYQVLNEFNDVVQVIDTVSNIEKYLQEHHQDLITLREEVFTEIEQIPVGDIQENLKRLEKKIDYICETYSTIDPEAVAKEIIQEGLLNEPPEIKNEDPLTSLDQNFVTLDQLQEHYRLFINRIQQQLSTFGGGGETQLKYLDDIVGIATNPGSYNGKFLKYDHSIGKFVFDDPATGGGGGSVDYANIAGIATYATTSGVSTYSQISGISTYSTSSGIATYSQVAGVSTYSNIAGIATYAQTSGIATSAGTATTATYLSDAANIITGTINKDRISTTNALTVLGDLYVSNNISFGGTVTQLNTEQLNIVDADIVLGIGTTFSPTDNTANHGGIAIASTEGSPLVNLNIVPEEINPTTYKKIMWFKGDTIGAGLTDAWLFNYAVGIGSTNVPNGVRLAAGAVQFTERDLLSVRNVNASGIITAASFVGNVTGTATTTNTVNILNTNGLTTVYYPTFVESRTDGQIVRADVDLTYRTDTNTLTVPNVSATTFTGALTGNATGLSGSPNVVVGIVTSDIAVPTQLRTRSVAERTTLVSGNTVGLVFTAAGGNVAICTNPTGDITLNVTNIPTDSSFDNHSISFSVIVTQTGTARTCTAINLNGVSRTIRWAGGSLSNAISGVTTSSGYDIFTFTGINTVGSASTTANYVILGSVNGGFN